MSQPNLEQSIFEDVDVGGDFTVGDITQIGSQTVIQQKPDFFEPALDRYKPSTFKSPNLISQLLTRLTNQRFLVLAGSSDVDKDSLAKHTAACLIESLSAQRMEAISKEWYRSSDPQSIDIELQNTEKTTVFILTQVNPQSFGYDLARIQKAANLCKHYIVMSTDVTFAAWRQPSSTKLFWYELSRGSVADAPQLINTLSQEEALSNWYHHHLKQPRDRLLALGLSFFDGLFDDQFFAALEEIVERVWQRRDASLRALDYRDLENLHTFFNFTETKNQGTKIAIRFPKQRRTLFKIAWHSDRRQILSALPVLVDLIRQSVVGRLANLELYGSDTKCKEIRTVIAETISDIGSISENAIQTTLLQLSADPNTDVQATAAYAMARWRDPEYSLDQQLFKTLHSWLDLMQARHIIAQVEAILRGRNSESSKSSKAEDYIKITVALTISYAALYDAPRGMEGSTGLSQECCDLLEKLATDPSPVVRDVFLSYTLPRALQIHLRQLRQWLQDKIQQQVSPTHSHSAIINFNQAIAASLAGTYRRDSEATIKILEHWEDEGRKRLSEVIDPAKVTSRESLLATVARTYGEIEPQPELGQLTASSIVDRLQQMLQGEKHPFVREAILFALCRQARSHFDEIEFQLQSLVANLQESEWQEIADLLSDIYVEQRVQLSGGDYWSAKPIQIGNYSYRYQIWTKQARPQTQIEEAMYHSWLTSESNPAAQQIALRAANAFADRVDRDEEQEQQRILNNLDREQTAIVPQPKQMPTRSTYNPLVKHFVPWLAVFLKWLQYGLFKRIYCNALTGRWSYYQNTVSNILPEALKQDLSSRFTMAFVIGRLRGLGSRDVQIIVDLLDLSIVIAKNPGSVVIIGLLLVGGLGWLLTLFGR
ncbi:VCBS repeat-containing protein [Leptolyngbya boryana NIES-2135]|jgi:hypothetical protein|uniref:VCBS repeat-containing protein n=1 Tax=Leptolyngbya boryana NIES-2135 TaxID=1973484 RepID=A0A1Z4JBW5_LEPBY|nr:MULTISPECIES: hypothetical protein [Leptolyngbya]BAY54168.1 VCBS repeat-containing protein [Leptolyngbya boryana NIES-2135]MBD2370999.1 hypothetical protein [Leptolyngbya sp. FACHB-161]MBD2377543.1 hypothetical protein [Leptolyngbya sp. FACHB-238]MBD2401951.1 hypothetical protein [Leptolyngbya sp. FACHB-239]MBD2408469.1 hypothetical protein [Leptolyngbya sp. FACHB-402]